MNVEEFKEVFSNEFSLQRLRKAFAGAGLPDSTYSIDSFSISEVPGGDYEGTMEMHTDGAQVVINFCIKPPLHREMNMSMCPMGLPIEVDGIEIHTFMGVLTSSRRAGLGEKDTGKVIKLFDS